MTGHDIATIDAFAAAFGRASREAKARQRAAATQAEADLARRHAAMWADVSAGLLELVEGRELPANNRVEAAE